MNVLISFMPVHTQGQGHYVNSFQAGWLQFFVYKKQKKIGATVEYGPNFLVLSKYYPNPNTKVHKTKTWLK